MNIIYHVVVNSYFPDKINSFGEQNMFSLKRHIIPYLIEFHFE